MFFRLFSRFFSNTAAAPLEPRTDARSSSGDTLRGLWDMGVASALFAAMAACVFQLSRLEMPVEAAMVSFIRVAVNFLGLLAPALVLGTLRPLFGDLRPALWLRGFFGGTSLILSFLSIQRIGPGESAFLTASSGFFVVLLAPWLLGQKSGGSEWLSMVLGSLGLFLLFMPEDTSGDLLGRLLGLASGFLAALAYLMVSRAGRSNSARSVVFYFSLVALLIHLVWFSLTGWRPPTTWPSFLLCGAAGVLGTLAQLRLTRAYQRAPAARVSAVGFLAPVLSLGLGALLFDQIPGFLQGLGCTLILIGGVALPVQRSRLEVWR